jgi:hypothetical protein
MRRTREVGIKLILLLFTAWPILGQGAADRLMEVEAITVTGTRLPPESVIRLFGIKLHDKVTTLSSTKLAITSAQRAWLKA